MVPPVLHVVVYEAEDLRGQWIAHVLDFDVMSQGNAPDHAIGMASAAAEICVDTIRRREGAYQVAPLEEWGRFLRICRTGRVVDALGSATDVEIACLVEVGASWSVLARWVATVPRDPAPVAAVG